MNKPITGFTPTARSLAQMRLATSKAKISETFAEMMAGAAIPVQMADEVAAGIAQLQTLFEPFPAACEKIGEVLKGLLPQAAVSPDAGQAKQMILDNGRDQLMQHLAELDGGANASFDQAGQPSNGYAALRKMDGAANPYAAPRQPQTMRIGDQVADALLARMLPGHTPTIGREFVSMRLEDFAPSRGVFGSSRQTRMSAMVGMGSADFSYALAVASNKVLLDSYEAALPVLKIASRKVSARDFRPINTVRVSGGAELEVVLENGEFKQKHFKDAGEAFSIKTFGGIYSLTRQAIYNDDLDVFGSSARLIGTTAGQTEASLFASLLQMNAGLGPTMGDGKTLFHVDHGNLAAAPAALSVTSISAARTAMRRQKGLAGDIIQVDPQFLVVPPELETVADQLVAQLAAVKADDVNPFAAKLTVLCDPNLTSATRWYIAAAPGRPDGLQHAYLDGLEGPQITTREGFEVDGTEFKVRLDFGCGFVDWRPWYMNPGA
jgi:hypothetical protein